MAEQKIAAVILAAGQSKRLGTPKQLVEFENETLLRRTAKTVTASRVSKTFVVLGHQRELMLPSLGDLRITPTFAFDFDEGLSHSVRHALNAVKNDENPFSAVLFVPCDLPLLHTDHLNDLIERHETTKAPIVCSKFDDILGIPAIFSAEIWPEFELLRGDKGARPIIDKCEKREFVSFEAAALDLDTPEDLQHWRQLRPNPTQTIEAST